MRNIFKKREPNELPNPVSDSEDIVVDSIQHETLDDLVRRDICNEIENDRRIFDVNKDSITKLSAKADYLKKFGFTNCKNVVDYDYEISNIQWRDSMNKELILLDEAIAYFKNKYPNYKLITMKSINTIRINRNLTKDSVDQYIGVVSDKNLKVIEELSILEDDRCCEKYDRTTADDFDKYYENADEYLSKSRFINVSNAGPMYRPCNLEILGNTSDFRCGVFRKCPDELLNDSIILMPVCYKNEKYYLLFDF